MVVPETVCVPVSGTAEAHGWNADKLHRTKVPALSGTAVNISTHCWVLKEQTFFPGKKYDPLRSSEIPAFFEGAGPEIPVWVGVLFENCTVDASIFVSKCVRAYGGCLGTRSR